MLSDYSISCKSKSYIAGVIYGERAKRASLDEDENENMTTASPLAICGLMVFIGMSNKNWKDTAFTLALATTYVVVSEREPRAK